MVSKHAATKDVTEATRLDQDAVRFHPEEITASLEGLGVDHLGALAVSDHMVEHRRRFKPVCIPEAGTKKL